MFQPSPFHHDTSKKESIKLHSFTSFTLFLDFFKMCLQRSLDLSGSQSGTGRVTGGATVNAFIALHSAHTPQTFSGSRHFDPWEGETSVSNDNNGDGTEVASLAGGQTITSRSKKGQKTERREAKGTAQTLMRAPPLSIHQDWEGKVNKTFESTVSL